LYIGLWLNQSNLSKREWGIGASLEGKGRRAQGELDHKQVLMDRGLEFYREVIMVYNTLQGFIVL
jgi:hypothetical protein